MSSRRLGYQSLTRMLGHWQQPSSRVPLWQQLASALRLLILDGRLTLGTRLPGERELSSALGISRTTVSSALSRLREQGFLVSQQGSGSRVVLPESRDTVPATMSAGVELDLSTASLEAGPEIYQAFSQALSGLPEHLSGTGYSPQGLPALREAIARDYQRRGLPTRADQIMIVNGAVSGLSLILRLLTGPGDRVLVDHPTYPSALSAIRGAACQPVGVSLGHGEWDLAGLTATLAQSSPRLAYMIADYHNPTGYCMDSAAREQLVAVAARYRTPLVIDETLAGLWYQQPPPLPVAAFAGSSDVYCLGSASKSFWGGLRVGWIRAPAAQAAALVQIRDSLDLGTPVMEQLACAWLVENREQFLIGRRSLLQQRRDHCARLMNHYFPDWSFLVPEGGLSFWVELPGMLATRFASRASDAGIILGTGTRFGLSGAFDRFLRMPFSADEATLEQAFRRLQPLWQALPDSPRPVTSRPIF